MRRRAEFRASVRRVASLLVGLVLAGSPAWAGDRALIDFLGYSPDGRHFAFETFGVQDGSGFPYADVYVIDLVADKWVPGTPVSVRLDNEAASLAEARAQAADKAEAVLKRFAITEPVEILALNGDGAADAAYTRLRFGAPGFGQGKPRSDQTLRLDSFESTSSLPCKDWFSKAPLGLSLTLEEASGERVIHRDKRLPESRGCAVDYRLFGVVQPGWARDTSSAVAIVSVYSGGFEGPDRRFIAVPIGKR